MKKILLILTILFTLILTGCHKPEVIREKNGCKIYRYYDNESYNTIYWKECNDSITGEISTK